jgi:hypothetical protein
VLPFRRGAGSVDSAADGAPGWGYSRLQNSAIRCLNMLPLVNEGNNNSIVSSWDEVVGAGDAFCWTRRVPPSTFLSVLPRSFLYSII